MNIQKLKKEWLATEKTAKIKGWNFTEIENEYKIINPSWNYRQIIEQYLSEDTYVLDIDTGGGEFLCSLHHPHHQISATEGYIPNVKLCERTLKPLGIDFHVVPTGGVLPFDDETFDMVINRHGTLNIEEIYRVLKTGGVFITQQVGAENDREFINMLLPDLPLQYTEQYLDKTVVQCEAVGFQILFQNEEYTPICFYTTKSLVWFAKVIEWEFIGFSVEQCLEKLLEIESKLEINGYIEGRTHRYVVVGRN